MTIPYHLKYEPQTLNQILHQDPIIEKTKRWISNNQIPNQLTVVGSSGVGKTVYTKNLIKATHCENRKNGEAEPCGYCNVCTSDPSIEGAHNVVWVHANPSTSATGKTISKSDMVNEALRRSEQGPYRSNNPDKEHREVLFIVLEEIQLLRDEVIQRIYSYSDSVDPFRNNVCYILITMQEEKIGAITFQALVDRGERLDFVSPTTTKVYDYLNKVVLNELIDKAIAYHEERDLLISEEELVAKVEKEVEIMRESLQIIAANSKGRNNKYSYRTALRLLASVQDITPLLDPNIVAEYFRISKFSERRLLWGQLQQGVPYTRIKELIDNLLYDVEQDKLIEQLLNDLDEGHLEGISSPEDFMDCYEELKYYLIRPIGGLYQIMYRFQRKPLVNLSKKDNFIPIEIQLT